MPVLENDVHRGAPKLPKGGSSTAPPLSCGETYTQLEIVGNCPTCGSPVYGRKAMDRNAQHPPPVRHSCSCRLPGFRTI